MVRSICWLALAGCANPQAPTLQILPEGATTVDDLRVWIQPVGRESTDLAIRWFADGQHQPDLDDEAVVESSRTTKGQRWAAEVLVPRTRTVETAERWIANTPPTVQIRILRRPPPLGGDVEVELIPFDIDGDTVSVDWGWSLDGEPVDHDSLTIPGDLTAIGQVWTLTATPHDEEEPGREVERALSIHNTPPRILSFKLTPSPPTRADTVEARVEVEDADEHDVSVRFRWRLNGEWLEHDGPTLSGDVLTRGDTLRVSATPFDPFDDGTPSFVDVTVANATPNPPEVEIIPAEPVAGIDDLTCAVTTPAFDADDDPLTSTIAWTANGVPYEGPTTTQTIQGDTVPASSAAAFGSWTCTITVSDGEAEATSNTASVSATP
jgi:hypothetical protein